MTVPELEMRALSVSLEDIVQSGYHSTPASFRRS